MNDREQLHQLGKGTQQELFGTEQPCAHPYLAQLMQDFGFGRIWARPGLGRRDRMIATLSALCVRHRLPTLEQYVPAALDAGLTPQSIDEIFIQCGIYAGFGSVSKDCLDLAARVYSARGIRTAASDEPSGAPVTVLAERGKAMMGRLHAERRHDGYASPDNPVTSSFYPDVVAFCYGEIWQRSGLETRERAICALASFTALTYTGLTSKFAKASLNVGLSQDEVIEVIVQTAPYTGLAPVLQALSAIAP